MNNRLAFCLGLLAGSVYASLASAFLYGTWL